MSDTREFKVSGDALAKRRRSTRKNQKGGDSGALMQLASQSSAVKDFANPDVQQLASAFAGTVNQAMATSIGPNKIQQFGGRRSQSKQSGGDISAMAVNQASTRAPTIPGSPAPTPVVSGISPSQPAAVGGARFIMAPPKRKTRISLKAKKHRGGSESLDDVPPMPGGGTRKARKIHLRVKGVTSRLAKAKKAKKMAMSSPLQQVKARLESAGVIKKGSKAPEHMLRNMYADLLITKKVL
jgi:hypothetical protein